MTGPIDMGGNSIGNLGIPEKILMLRPRHMSMVDIKLLRPC